MKTLCTSFPFIHGLLLYLIVAKCGTVEGEEVHTANSSNSLTLVKPGTRSFAQVCLQVDRNPLYAYKFKNKSSLLLGHVSKSVLPLQPRPVCDIDVGCKPRLQCLNLSSSEWSDVKVSTILNQGRVVKVNATQLQYLLDMPKFTNMCMVVMFYANWCQYSVDFSPTYNMLGRLFPQLPFLAVDYGEQDPDKFILAYLPRVLLYYNSRIVFNIDPALSVEKLEGNIANFTELPSHQLDPNTTDHASPLPDEREANRSILFLYLGWLLFVAAVFMTRLSPVKNCLLHTSSRLQQLIGRVDRQRNR